MSNKKFSKLSVLYLLGALALTGCSSDDDEIYAKPSGYKDPIVEVDGYDEKIHNVYKENIETIWDNKYFKVRIEDVDGKYVLKNDDYLVVTSLSNNIIVDNHQLNIGNSFVVCANQKEALIEGNGKIVVVNSK